MNTTKTTIRAAALLLAVPLVLATPSSAQSNEGETLARQISARSSGYGDFEARVTMTVGSTERQLRLRALESDEGTHSLLLFDSPSDVRGTALLSRMDGGDVQQWLYLPAMRRSRRVAGGQLSAAFLGSEFSYEDISGSSMARYRWRALGEAPCTDGGSDTCVKLESRARFDGSGYTRRVLFVDRAHSRVHRILHYGERDQLVKTLVNSEWRQHLERHWRAHRWTMTNHTSGRSTVIQVRSYEFGNGYTARDFSRNALGRTR